jgi:hypothetical protein
LHVSRGSILVWLIVALASLAGTAPAIAMATQGATPGADALPQFAINPVEQYPHGYVELTVEPGQSQTVAARLVNSGTVDVSLIVHAANVTNPPNGGFAAGTADEEPTGPTAWLDFEAFTVDLAPGEARDLSVGVTVPDDAAPGQYVTALVAATSEPLAISGTTAFNQIIRNAAPIMITVPGPAEAGFSLGEPAFNTAAGDNRLEIPIANTGNVLVRPAGTLTVSTADGNPVVTAPIALESIYGGLSTIILMPLPDQLPPGEYRVSVTLEDDASGITATVDAAPTTLADYRAENPATFVVDPVSVTPNGDPIRYADISATITNNGPTISTANITLNVFRDGEEVERYPLAQNQALPQGTTEFKQRYIPLDDWQPGTWTFQLVIASVDGGTETVLATVAIDDEIVVP